MLFLKNNRRALSRSYDFNEVIHLKTLNINDPNLIIIIIIIVC